MKTMKRNCAIIHSPQIRDVTEPAKICIRRIGCGFHVQNQSDADCAIKISTAITAMEI